MAYLINKTNGQLLVSILDNQADGPNINPGFNASDLNLFGKNYAIYGELLNENFVKLLENFSNNTPPTTPIRGQLWFDTSNPLSNKLKVYNGTNFVEISPITVNATQPTVASQGDIWWDSAREQMFVYTGAYWALVGPQFSSDEGKSGAIAEPIWDLAGNRHMVVKFYSANNLGAMYSYDQEFTANVEIPGFGSNVAPGFTMNSNIAGLYRGSATNSLALGGILPEQYARKDISETFASNIAISGGDLSIGTSTSGNAIVKNIVNNASIEFRVVTNGVDTRGAYIHGATGHLKTELTPSISNDVTNKLYVDSVVSSAVAPLASTAYVDTQIDNVYQFANTAITFAVSPLAETEYVDELVTTSVAPLALQTYVEAEFANLKNYTDTLVNTAVNPLTSQANLNLVENDLTAYVDGKFVRGMIMMWYGSLLTMPPGWVLCDGNNGTPDLRDRFVVGAGAGYDLNNTGGRSTVTLTQNEMPAHAHGATAATSAAEHSHTLTVNSTDLEHSHTIVISSSSAAHSHGFTTNPTNINHYHTGTTSGQSQDHTHGFGGTTSSGGRSGWFAVGGGNYAPDNSAFTTTFPYGISARPGLDARSGGQERINYNAAHTHNISGTTGGASNDHTHFITTGGMNTNASHSHTGTTDSSTASHTHTGTINSVDLTHSHTGTTNTVTASHTHNVVVNSAGSGNAFDIRPPYMALYYIMKT